jgi:hypothetical protein
VIFVKIGNNGKYLSTFSGRFVTDPSLVIDMDEVFEARITFAGVIAESSFKIASFTLKSSLTAF